MMGVDVSNKSIYIYYMYIYVLKCVQCGYIYMYTLNTTQFVCAIDIDRMYINI